MVMSSKQKEDLNYAIFDYLETQGFAQAAAVFRKEANIDENSDPTKKAQNSGMLEKKWTLVIRLQQRILTLEEKIKQMDREVMSGGPSRETRQPGEWIPRPPERSIMQGHRLPVTKVVFHPLFSVIASSSEDCTIKIWDFESGEFERSLKGHTDSVQDVNFNSSGKLMVSCSADMTVKIWDFDSTYECLKTLKGHDHNVSSACFLPSGDFVLSSSRDKLIKLWDVANGYCVQNFYKHSDWVRMVLVNQSGTLFASCSNDKTIIVWCLATKTPKITLVGHEHVVECLHWVPEKYSQAIIDSETYNKDVMAKLNGSDLDHNHQQSSHQLSILISGSRDRTIKFWDVFSGSCLFTLYGHDNWVRGLRLHPNGKILVSVGDDKTMRIWSVEHRRCNKVMQAHPQFVTSLDFHPKLPFVVTSSVDTTIKVWECR